MLLLQVLNKTKLQHVFAARLLIKHTVRVLFGLLQSRWTRKGLSLSTLGRLHSQAVKGGSKQIIQLCAVNDGAYQGRRTQWEIRQGNHWRSSRRQQVCTLAVRGEELLHNHSVTKEHTRPRGCSAMSLGLFVFFSFFRFLISHLLENVSCNMY